MATAMIDIKFLKEQICELLVNNTEFEGIKIHENNGFVQNLLIYITSLKCEEISKKEVFNDLKVRGKRKNLLQLVQTAFRIKRPDIVLLHRKPK
jgi:hypothetical protein